MWSTINTSIVSTVIGKSVSGSIIVNNLQTVVHNQILLIVVCNLNSKVQVLQGSNTL